MSVIKKSILRVEINAGAINSDKVSRLSIGIDHYCSALTFDSLEVESQRVREI